MSASRVGIGRRARRLLPKAVDTKNRRLPRQLLLVLALLFAGAVGARAQDNYEIQVYGSETVPTGRTMVELHSNYTLAGRSSAVDGLLPTNHALHETLEITHGFTEWAEVGVYVFTSARGGDGVQWVGSHIRPRVRAPVDWHWPVGASLSAEFGYQRAAFSADTWTLELRPIVDRQFGPWYAALNPTLGRSFRGPGTASGLEFAPSATVGLDVSSRVNLALEYYSVLGSLRKLDPAADQQRQLFGVVNLNVGPDWEINAGYGQALTAGGDRKLIKLILGRRLGRARKDAS